MSITTIMSELRQGSTIEHVCRNHGLSFMELFMMCDSENRKDNHEKELTTGELYISKKGKDYFVLRKGQVYYGAFYSLDDARKVRDYFIFNRWDKRKVDSVCDIVGVVRRNNKRGRY